jgi:hypothetical protein
MAIGKPPREIDDTERARSMPEAEATALSTIAMTMFLGVLAEAEASRRQELNAVRPEETPTPTATPQATGGHAPPPEPSPQQPEHQPADGVTTATPTAHPDFTSLTEPSRFSEASRHEADTAAATASSSQSDDHGAIGSGSISDLHAQYQTDSANWTGLAGTAPETAGHHLAEPMPALNLADSLQDSMARLSTSIADIGTDLQHHLASVTSALSNLTTTIASDVSSLSATVSDTVASVTHVVASVPASIADALVSGVLGSASHVTTPDITNHDLPMLDTGGVVPVPFDHSPLQLGFLGQPHTDGHHDMQHDGAFSALGLH